MPNGRFPGVYVTVSDQSLAISQQSRFSCGLVGVASRGPFNSAISVPSLATFASNFGQSVPGSFLAAAVAAVTDSGGDGCSVVRVGTQYGQYGPGGTGSGLQGSYTLISPFAQNFSPNDFLQIKQPGLPSTLNAVVQSIGFSGGTINLVSTGAQAVPLAANYTLATIQRSTVADSANAAEALLTAPTYGPVLSAAGTVTATKSAYTFTVSGSTAALAVGNVIKIVQANKATTREVYVTAINALSSTISISTTAQTNIGVQALPIQDNYTAGQIYVVTAQAGQTAAQLNAATAGTWANTIGNVGLTLTVSPGSLPDTKKFLIYLNGALAETVDNLNTIPGDPNNFVTALANDKYVNVLALYGTEPPGNTVAPWNLGIATPSNTPVFNNGFNGENVAPSDYVGTVNANEISTGLQVFNDKSNFGGLFALCAPGATDMAITQQLAVVANNLNAVGLVDVPDNIPALAAIDYTNGQGLYANYGSINNYRVAYFWNWFQSLDPFNGVDVWTPPTVGVLGAMSASFDQYKPWYAVAGQNRGALTLASSVRYPRLRESTKQLMAQFGNVLNPIILYQGVSINIWGNLTAKRLAANQTDFLTELSIVQLVNYIVKNMAAIGQKYLFDPDDATLESQLSLDYTNFMETVRTERGVSSYLLTVDCTSPAQVNAQSALVNLAIIPIPDLEVINLNVIVNAAGAVLTAVTSGGTTT